MVEAKITTQDVKDIGELIKKGIPTKDIAKKYGVSRSTIQRRCKDYLSRKSVTLEQEQRLRKLIKQGYSKAEAAQTVGINIGTAYTVTKDLPGSPKNGTHVIRKQAIVLLNRLLSDGYLIDGFVMATAHTLQEKFPTIQSARYKQKTFFYLSGRERETIEAFFKLKPDRIINYQTLEEISYLLGVELSGKDKRNLVDKYKGKHSSYWKSRHLTQRSLDDWIDDSKNRTKEVSFRLMPRKTR